MLFVVTPVIFFTLTASYIFYRDYTNDRITVGSLLFDVVWGAVATALIYLRFIKDYISKRHSGTPLPSSDRKAIKMLQKKISELRVMHSEILSGRDQLAYWLSEFEKLERVIDELDGVYTLREWVSEKGKYKARVKVRLWDGGGEKKYIVGEKGYKKLEKRVALAWRQSKRRKDAEQALLEEFRSALKQG